MYKICINLPTWPVGLYNVYTMFFELIKTYAFIDLSHVVAALIDSTFSEMKPLLLLLLLAGTYLNNLAV